MVDLHHSGAVVLAAVVVSAVEPVIGFGLVVVPESHMSADAEIGTGVVSELSISEVLAVWKHVTVAASDCDGVDWCVVTAVEDSSTPVWSQMWLILNKSTVFWDFDVSVMLNEREDGSLRYGVLGEIVCGVVGSELRDYFLLDSTIVSFFYICIRRHLTIISCLVCSSLMHIIVARNTWREFLVDITYRYNKIQ